MREYQQEPTIEVGQAQEDAYLFHSIGGWLVANDLDLGQVHLHPMIIHDISQALNLFHDE
jgi:hypothetical protein